MPLLSLTGDQFGTSSDHYMRVKQSSRIHKYLILMKYTLHLACPPLFNISSQCKTKKNRTHDEVVTNSLENY